MVGLRGMGKRWVGDQVGNEKVWLGADRRHGLKPILPECGLALGGLLVGEVSRREASGFIRSLAGLGMTFGGGVVSV